jgi:hypothetical protein
MPPTSVRNVDVVSNESGLKDLRSASTIGELIDCLPSLYRPTLNRFLNDAYRVSLKSSGVQSTLTTLRTHKSEETVPPMIKGMVRDSKIQWSKEYKISTEGQNVDSFLAQKVKEARQAILDAVISKKEAELKKLQSLLSFQSIPWIAAVNQVTQDVLGNLGGKIHTDDKNRMQFSGVPAGFQEEYELLVQHGSDFHLRAISLAQMVISRDAATKLRKLSVKKETDIEMTGVDDKSPETLVKEAMSSAKQELVSKAQFTRLENLIKKSMSQPDARTSSQDHADSILRSKRKREKEDLSPREKRRQGNPQGQPRKERISAGNRKEQVVQEVREMIRGKPKNFSLHNSCTYPQAYFSSTLTSRKVFQWSQTNIGDLKHWRESQPGIFQGPGVSIPNDIEFILSVNHKFILRQDIDLNLVHDAYSRFERNVRVKWQFRDQENSDFIPRLHVANPTWLPRRAAPHIEQGLKAGKESLNAQLRAIPNTAFAPHPGIGWKKVRAFLESNDILLKLTDKNLGLAALTKTWYVEQMEKLLSDRSVYDKYPKPPPQLISEYKRGILGVVKQLKLPLNYAKYIDRTTKESLPRFHIIPKVHKEPWKGRPIVPSHSWITTSISECIDEILRPCLTSMPWVVHSTKEVVNKLEGLRHQEKDVWLLTGDVESFYTNVSWNDAVACAESAHHRFSPSHPVTPHQLASLVKLVMEYNFFEANGELYHQTQGVAMGTSCAPLLANLVVAKQERSKIVHQGGVPRDRRVLLYLRYMDDILALVYGDEKDVTDVSNNSLKLDGFNVTWSYSKTRTVFLDLEILEVPSIYGLQLHTRVYRKPMNRFLYIPWSSAHPDTVKKGFVKAELTRFVTNCSLERYYVETASFFRYCLRRRGYPKETLDNWMRQVSYANRSVYLLSRKTSHSPGPLMLPSEYNPVWEYVNMKELTAKIRVEWSKDTIPEALDVPVIKSLKRTTALQDMMTLWNLTILS